MVPLLETIHNLDSCNVAGNKSLRVVDPSLAWLVKKNGVVVLYISYMEITWARYIEKKKRRTQ